jgi:hypothetical protein
MNCDREFSRLPVEKLSKLMLQCDDLWSFLTAVRTCEEEAELARRCRIGEMRDLAGLVEFEIGKGNYRRASELARAIESKLNELLP